MRRGIGALIARLGGVLALAGLLVGAGVASSVAQGFSALARLDVAQSQVHDTETGLAVELYLSQPVPYRAYLLAAPPRLILDFREVDFRGANRAAMMNSDRARTVRFGAIAPGWSRLVVELREPMQIDVAGMAVDRVDGTAFLDLRMEPVDAAAFADLLGAPPDPIGQWTRGTLPAPPVPSPDAALVVAIDPGHGGIDPGAERGGLREADLMLALALELQEALLRIDGIEVVLTRSADVFVPLSERMTIARAAEADVLVSLHADALEADVARGASIYTLSPAAQENASARMAERHERGDLLSGVDLSGQDDTVATILMDLARLETGPQSERLAAGLVTALSDAGARLNSRPLRSAPLAVLNAADFPSVLVEAGFLSSDADRQALSTSEGRAPLVAGLVRGLQRWAVDEAARAPLLRQ